MDGEELRNLDRTSRLSLAQEIIAEFRRLESELSITRSQLSALLAERADMVHQLNALRSAASNSVAGLHLWDSVYQPDIHAVTSNKAVTK